MKRTLFSIAAILCASVVLFSCSKDNDPVYPDDPQALTSVFNVKSSDWLSNDAGNYDVTFDMTEITESITDMGAVWIYYSFNGGNSYELAPSLTRTDDKGHSFDFLAESGDDTQGGYVLLTAVPYSDNSGVPSTFDGNQIQIKVVSIPSSLYNAHKNVNKEDYNEVRRVFNLK
ncbi:hypothetical protein [Arachidicoccus terrestris]|uniref:hypothetical protein n=1 Tax=Arachidicoccus terrestris TaxID=2875539 RepID=UPI001CC6058A|nr:hypothetical protein [Arachidicoccus terrestris]UAY54490.1 hypothetical protein K9M52_13645 [Arachidicoccus terrestris]